MMKYHINTLNERVFSFIYGCALHDAILQKSFNGKKDWIGKVTSAQQPVKEYINDVLNGKYINATDKSAHDTAFLNASLKICETINANNPQEVTDNFSFGNAQKLLNITVKHIYAHTYSINLLTQTNIRQNFRFCHCPMDFIMLSHVWDKYKESFGISERSNKLGKRDTFFKSWGAEDFDVDENGKKVIPKRYLQYQDAIDRLRGDNIFPIEYDYLIWKNS